MKKQKSLLGISLVMGCCLSAQAEETTLSILKKDGSITEHLLKDDGKVHFEGDNMIIKTTAESESLILPINTLQKVTFSDITSINDVDNATLKVFPNPTKDFVFISDLSEGELVEIFSTNGNLARQAHYSETRGVSLNHLPDGTYLLRAGEKTTKISKK